jgi:hypothetical protein
MTTNILPHATHFSEFATDPVTGVHYNGTCTQTALAVCLGIADEAGADADRMMLLTRDMISKKLCAANGAATVAAVAQEARDHGFTIDTEWDFGSLGDWHTKLKTLAAHKPILLQIANGQALTDAETGAKDESGLHYHAIAIVGYQDNGYVCADGDNPQVAERFQIYSYATLAAAQPCGLLIINLVKPPETTLADGTTAAQVAALKADNARYVALINKIKGDLA